MRKKREPLQTKPFTVGCLAMCLRPASCCGEHEGMGVPFTVTDIDGTGVFYCSSPICQAEHTGKHLQANAAVDDIWYSAKDCIRIDDPAVQTTVKKRKRATT